jgi:4-amino-4-deoxy-L-arabinose transferase-like glycosyltransferase
VDADEAPARADRGALVGGVLLAALVVGLLVPFLTADPPRGLTGSNAAWTDEGFNLASARERVLSGRFATGDVDRSLTNGAYSAIAAGVFAVTRPRMAAGRAISVAAVAAAVLLLAVGLAEPLGRGAALLAAAALAGSDLILEYGRLALVEPTVVALLAVAFVLAVRAPARPSAVAGAGLGLALAAAISVKAIAAVPAAAMLAVVLGAALHRRDRHALRMGLLALGVAVAAGLIWLLAVALPNLDRLRTALEIWPAVDYLAAPWTLASRLWSYLASGADGALLRSLPLLAATAVGLVAAGLEWRRLGRGARDALLIAALWGFGLWAAIGAGDYLPTLYVAPNRYVVPALPGLAVLAGFGIARLAGALARGRRRAAGAVLAAVLALAVAAPGAARYLSAASGSGDQRERDQAALAARLPRGAVVFGAYAPTLLFDTRMRLLSAWLPAGANVDDPVGRFGVDHVLATEPADASDPTSDVPAFRDVGGSRALAVVRWGDRTIGLYGVAASAPAAR